MSGWGLITLLKSCDEAGWGGLVMLRGEMSCVGWGELGHCRWMVME